MSMFIEDSEGSNRLNSERVNYLKQENINTAPKITETSNLKKCYPSMESESFVYTVETLNSKSEWSSNIHYQHLDSFKSYPLTRSGGFHSPVIAADMTDGAAENVLFYLKEGALYCMPLSRGGEAIKVSSFPLPIRSYKIFQDERDAQRIKLCFVMDVEVENCPSPDESTEEHSSDKEHSSEELKQFVENKKRYHVFICSLEITEDGLYTVSTDSVIDLMLHKSIRVAGKCLDLRQGLMRSKGAYSNSDDDYDDSYSISPNGRKITMSICDSGRRSLLFQADLDEFKAEKNSNNSNNGNENPTSNEMERKMMYVPEKSYAQAAGIIHVEEEHSKELSSEEHSSTDHKEHYDNNYIIQNQHLEISKIVYNGITDCPVFSSDNTQLAYLTSIKPENELKHKTVIQISDFFTNSVFSLTDSVPGLSFDCVQWGVPHGGSEAGPSTLFATAKYRGSSRVFRITLTHNHVGKVTGYSSLEVMGGDESRTNISLALPAPPAGMRITKNNHSGEIRRVFLYYIESSHTTPDELKMAILNNNDEELFSVFNPVENTDLQGLIPSSPNCSYGIQSMCAMSPECSNGDIEMPRVTQHFVRNKEGEMVIIWYAAPLLPGMQNTEEAYRALPLQSLPLIIKIRKNSSDVFLNQWTSGPSNTCSFAAHGFGVISLDITEEAIYRKWKNDGRKQEQKTMLHRILEYVCGVYGYIDPDRYCIAE